MRTFRCPACGCELELPKVKEVEAICCSECRQWVHRSVFDPRQDEQENDWPRQRPPRFWRWLAKNVVWSRAVKHVESGFLARISVFKAVFHQAEFVIAFLVFLFFATLGPFLLAAKLGIVPGRSAPGWVVLLMLMFSAFAVFCMYVFGKELIGITELWRREERLIVGESSVQCIIGKDRARLEVPYDVIENLSLTATRGDIIALFNRDPRVAAGPRIPFIGIELKKDWKRSVIADPRMERWGFDIVIRDYYEVRLDLLFERMVQQWRLVTGASGRHQEQEIRYFRRWAKVATVIQICIAAVFVVPCCCMLPTTLIMAVLVDGWAPGRNLPAKSAVRKVDEKETLQKLAGMSPDRRQAEIARQLAERLGTVKDFDRPAVIRALSVWATEKEIPILIEALNDKDLFVRQAALWGVGRSRDERVLPHVLSCFEARHTRKAAKKALCEMGSMAEKGVLEYLERDRMRRDVIEILSQIGTRQSVRALEELQDHPTLGRKVREALTAIEERAGKK